MLANRPDILREDYMNELCVLQDDVPPFPDKQVRPVSMDPRGKVAGYCGVGMVWCRGGLV